MTGKTFLFAICIILAGVFVGACGGTTLVSSPVPDSLSSGDQGLGDPEAGLLAFNDHCFECHSTKEGVAIAGPSLFNAGDKFSYEYVKQSIQDPHKIVIYVDNPQFAGVEMPDEIVAELSEQEFEDIIAYVLSQLAAAGVNIDG